MSQALHPMLNIAIKAARSAGGMINRASLDLDALKINTKSPNDFVTEVDQNAEAMIIDILLGAYPHHAILAEESGSKHGNQGSDFVWIIDPLDGTTNFIHGFPVYAVSIALAYQGQIQQAVVYDPTRNDLFFASKGKGAFLNNKRLRVSKRTRLSDCLISTGFPFRKGDNFKRYMQIFEVVMQSCAGLRRPGSAALDLCYVAAGYTDGFFETGLSPWDIAAGSLLVTEAGGLIGNFTGESDYLYQREVLAGSPKIYGQLVTMLQPYSHVIVANEAKREYSPATEIATENVAQQPRSSSTLRAPGAQKTSAFARAASLSDQPKIASNPTPEPAPNTPQLAITPMPATKAPVRISKANMALEKQVEQDNAHKPAHHHRRQDRDAPF
jgi:myo-inositol-1(or 4)-monophosphatase